MDGPSHGSNGHPADDGQFHPGLSTIDENKVTCFSDEDEPLQYPRITNKILSSVDESFLYSSLGNLAEPEVGHRRRAATMQNIHEKASFLNLTSESHLGKVFQKALIYLKTDMTFGSISGLNTAVVDQNYDKKILLPESSSTDVIASGKYTKNLLVVGLTTTLLFIALGSVRNLQSSMNHEDGVGVISTAVSFVGYMVGSVFSLSLVQIFQPRSCMIAGIVPHFVYVAANVYPAMWLMVPVSMCQGVGLAVFWNSLSTYVTLLARGRAKEQNEVFSVVSARYFGIFGLFFQAYFIIGNLISSLVLSSGTPSPDLILLPDLLNSSSINITNSLPHHITSSFMTLHENLSLNASDDYTSEPAHIQSCGSSFMPHDDLGGTSFHIDAHTKYLLLGIYMASVLASMALAVVCLEKLNPRLLESPISRLERVKTQLTSLVKFSTRVRFLLLLPLMVFSFMEVGFVTADFTKAYVTCALGIHMVGYTMICLGVCGSLSAYLSGLLTQLVGRVPQILFAVSLNLGVLVHMIYWKPSPDWLVPFFVDLGLWGISDGIWVSQVNSLLSVVFPNHYEEAFAFLRIAQGLGSAMAFGYSNVLGMMSKIYITGSICLAGVTGYLIMEWRLRRSDKKSSGILRETTI
ncbi:protein unc-93 homolog A-like [Physella acuta]|uniref:protein unc-93 homolog A-like n=1 Tax=Physella acuta TaxID=109671 RepID=UPI0027DD1F4F|nr:protein unc-93 homolog A-like [Physella acuta]XP_059169342.1 protein unc-93 homolog A-like [Physella acuta]XP_059169343.1 protein unc-93 homolog A-like [Physella acuta]